MFSLKKSVSKLKALKANRDETKSSLDNNADQKKRSEAKKSKKSKKAKLLVS